MTTQEKTAAIQDIVKNHQDNVAAKEAANVGTGLDPLVIEAMNNAFKADLEKVFIFKTVKPPKASHRAGR
ncbi:MAG TPA: hypothetical protein VGM62_01595 [Chthoniobacterales bacterium]|jgi:hypothetical protein